MKKYIPSVIEPKWQRIWAKNGLYKTNLSKPNKFYCLAEFTYPSGDLHMGHWFTFGGADIYARFKRMQGYNVFFPNGFDSFGLPAEGTAIRRKIHPKDWTESNIKTMKEQFATMGASFDFYKNLSTCDPKYYRWNQWIFLKMLEKGLAYRGKYISNWCPFDQTVLANEAVENGRCWRCGQEVIQKEVEQWFFKITDFAERLIWPENPEVNWPKSVRDAQNEWIGRSEGVVVEFKLVGIEEVIEVFTTRIDTIYGATFLVLAPEHHLVPKLTAEAQKAPVAQYLKLTKKKNELERKENKEKSGVASGSFAVNPFSGEHIPVWVADYVLPGYGTGAIMAVPSHDLRDFEFAKKNNLGIKKVIEDGEGILVNSGEFSGLESEKARQNMAKYAEDNNIGFRETYYHIHDWSISRQRYWGTPIPVTHCKNCGIVPVPYQDLPVELPYDVDYQPKGKSPLASNENWLNVKCPKCGASAQRDPDTMDTFVDSSWYFFRYTDPEFTGGPFDKKLAQKILPVDIYFGGAEHTLGHTLYSRFFTKFLHDLGLTELEEYALRRVNHGIVLGPDGNKMSKSKGNVVNPDAEVKKYGADAVRTYLAFFMPYEGTGPWVSDRIWGTYRFLERVWQLFDKVSNNELSEDDLYIMHKTIRKVTDDIEQVKFNTAVAALMEWLNWLVKKTKVSNKEFSTFLKLLSPFAPHITEELWEMMREKESIHLQKWPEVDKIYLQQAQSKIVVQVNGKVRETLLVQKNIVDHSSRIEKIAGLSPRVQKFIAGKTIKKVVYIKGKILNFVI